MTVWWQTLKLVSIFFPLIGIILLKSGYTSADLIDQVDVKTNNIKATTLSISIQNTVDNTNKSFLFDLGNFQKDSLEATTIRVRNSGEESTKYYLGIKLKNDSEICQLPILKIFSDDKLIFADKIGNLNLEMPVLAKGEKNDLIILLKMADDITGQSPTTCSYQVQIATTVAGKSIGRLSDLKNIDSRIQIDGTR